jgi:hypothetical protein
MYAGWAEGELPAVDLGLISRNRVTRNSAKKPTISAPSTVSIVVSVVTVVIIIVAVNVTGSGIEVVVEAVMLVSVAIE